MSGLWVVILFVFGGRSENGRNVGEEVDHLGRYHFASAYKYYRGYTF